MKINYTLFYYSIIIYHHPYTLLILLIFLLKYLKFYSYSTNIYLKLLFILIIINHYNLTSIIIIYQSKHLYINQNII